MKKYISIILLTILMLIITLPIYAENEIETETINVKAKVVQNNGTEEIVTENEPTKKVQKVLVRILEGEYENENYEMEYLISKDIDNITNNVELNEDEKIVIAIQEKEGEIINISYIETVEYNYTLYIIGFVLVILLFFISRKRAIIIYLITIIVSGFIIIFSLQNGWNLIMVSSILSLVITIILYVSINKINKETFIMILRAVFAIAVSGILIYLLFDLMHLESMNIKVTDKFVDIKSLICSATILFSQGIYNSIAISGQYIFYATNKTYKTKSDNIIEGQRSLKL